MASAVGLRDDFDGGRLRRLARLSFIDGYRGDQLILIGKRLQEMRLGRGFTLVEMAKYLRSSPATLSRLERGQLARSRLFRDAPNHAQTEFESRPVVIVHKGLRALLAYTKSLGL